MGLSGASSQLHPSDSKEYNVKGGGQTVVLVPLEVAARLQTLTERDATFGIWLNKVGIVIYNRHRCNHIAFRFLDGRLERT